MAGRPTLPRDSPPPSQAYEDLKASNAYHMLAEAGLETARARCPRFDAWLTHWEQWGMQA